MTIREEKKKILAIKQTPILAHDSKFDDNEALNQTLII